MPKKSRTPLCNLDAALVSVIRTTGMTPAIPEAFLSRAARLADGAGRFRGTSVPFRRQPLPKSLASGRLLQILFALGESA